MSESKYKEYLQDNNLDLRSILDTVKNLPEDGGEVIEPIIEPLEITENGTYTAPDGVDGYSPITVNVANSGGGESADDLPTGYVRCDYIQFSGKQIVDSGIVCSQNTKIYTYFTRESSTQEYLYGVASSYNTASVTAYLGGSWRFGNKYATKPIGTISKYIGYGALVSNTEIGVTGSVSSISGVNDFETVGSLLIGSCRNSSGSLGTAQYNGKIFFFAMWQGEVLVLKLVPVVSGEGVYRFWDAVSKTFFDSVTDTPLDGGNV